MDTLLQDLRFAFRSLRRTPGFAFTVIGVMALGIGVNSLIYTVVRDILFADLPFHEPERMVAIQVVSKRNANPFEMSLPDVRDVMARTHSLRGVSGWTGWNAFVAAGDEPQRFRATMASAGLPEALGVPPKLGRLFTPDECRQGPHFGPVVLSARVWREQFSADPHVLGRTLHMNGRVRTIVGVMPEGFRFPELSDFFVPLPMDDTSDTRASHYLDAVARLAPGVTLRRARAEIATLASELAKAYPITNAGTSLVLTEFREHLVGEIRPILVLLTLAVVFVLLIACANVANLMLARAAGRHREIGVRIALGATRGRLLRQMLTESLLLSLLGGGLGALLGEWGLRITVASIPEPLPYWMHFDLDPQVLLVVLGVSLLAGMAFGLAPAWHATSGDVLTPLREGTPGGGDSPNHRRLRSGLVVAEVSITVLLLIGSGLMVRSFLHQVDQRLSLRADRVLTGSVTLPVALYPSDTARVAFFHELRGSFAALPGVRSVGGVLNLHLGSSQWTMSVRREGVDAEIGPDSQNPSVGFNVITPGYLDAVGLQLLRGRDFTDGDVEGAPRVALVNQVAATALWPKQDPIGKRLRSGREPENGWTTIVGVVANVRQHARARGRDVGEMLIPHAQSGNQSLFWALRTDGNPGALAPVVRRALRNRDPNLAFADGRTLTEHVRIAIWQSRVYAQLMGVFSLVALIIAALGIHGVMAYTVAQRTREICIRMALGAARADVQRMIVGQALRLMLLGSGIGLALAYALTRFMQSQLFGIRPDDPPTFVGVTLILAVSSAVAAWLPTARAVRVDPVVALRHE